MKCLTHIHGDKDNVLPIRKVKADKVIADGTHKMVVNHSDQLSQMINEHVKLLLLGNRE